RLKDGDLRSAACGHRIGSPLCCTDSALFVAIARLDRDNMKPRGDFRAAGTRSNSCMTRLSSGRRGRKPYGSEILYLRVNELTRSAAIICSLSRIGMRRAVCLTLAERDRRQRFCPRCEQLESRCVPSIFSFSTGNPDGKMASASRPANGAAFEIESADDFLLTTATEIKSATFTGLIPSGATINQVVVEIYRVFPNDSDVSRTSGPPTFSTPQVPTRVNSPSDVAFNS